VEFRLFVSQKEDGTLPRIAYQLSWRNKLVLDTSYLGFLILDQEPLLGENDGLTSWHESAGAMTAEYMQNGSIGREITIEARIWNEGVAFRYVVPRTTPLQQIQIEDELTEFAFKAPSAAPVAEIPGAGWVAIAERGTAGSYPPMKLTSGDDPDVLVTHFDKVWESTTPLTTPWRVIGLGDTAQQAKAAAAAFRP